MAEGNTSMALHTSSAPTGVTRSRTSDTRRWWALALLCVAQFMLILDVTVVNVALPDIGADLHLQRATLTWVLTAYTLVFGGLMLLGGRASDRSEEHTSELQSRRDLVCRLL